MKLLCFQGNIFRLQEINDKINELLRKPSKSNYLKINQRVKMLHISAGVSFFQCYYFV
jgi:hypothetical protein